MNELIKIKTNEDGKQLVSARELHEGLRVQQDFTDWIKKQLDSVDAMENVDFTRILFKREANNANVTDYIITTDTAKEICMVVGVAPRTNKETKELSKQYRRYFIDCEKKLKEIANRPSYQIEDTIERAKKWIEEQEEIRRLALQIEEKEEIIEDITNHALTISESRKVIRRLVGSLAKDVFHNHYDKAWNALYRQLNYNLDIRVKRRNKDKRESLLDTLTEEETYELEKIARNLCVVHNISIDEKLSMKPNKELLA